MLIFALLMAIIALLGIVHSLENRVLPADLQRFGWGRSFQVFFAIVCAGVIIAAFQKNIAALNAQLAARDQIIEAQKTALAESVKVPVPQIEESQTVRMDFSTPAPKDSNSLESIYNPEEADTSKQGRIDELKKRYEEMLVSHFLLRSCERANPTDYHIITSALAQDMASIGAPSRLQYDILIAAQGSYKEMYGKTPCSDARIDALYGQYKTYIDAVEKQYNVR